MHHENIREHMPVVCSNGGQVGTVDHVEGEQIKLTRDESGQHHYIPMSMVSNVDDSVHLNIPGEQVKQQWRTEAASGMRG